MGSVDRVPHDSPEQPEPPEATPDPGHRGSERFNMKGALICMIGSSLGGTLSQELAKMVSPTHLTPLQVEAFTLPAFLTGAVIFGFLIPTEIYRRAHNETWRNIWNRLNS